MLLSYVILVFCVFCEISYWLLWLTCIGARMAWARGGGHLPPGNVEKCFCLLQMLSKTSADEVFVHHFAKMSSACGALPPYPRQGSAPGPGWETSILQIPSLPNPGKIPSGAHVDLLATHIPLTHNHNAPLENEWYNSWQIETKMFSFWWPFNSAYRLFDYLINWSIDWLINWLIDWLIDDVAY